MYRWRLLYHLYNNLHTMKPEVTAVHSFFIPFCKASSGIYLDKHALMCAHPALGYYVYLHFFACRTSAEAQGSGGGCVSTAQNSETCVQVSRRGDVLQRLRATNVSANHADKQLHSSQNTKDLL